MANEKEKDRNISLNDIRSAMAEEHPERDAGLSTFMAMTSDSMEEQQPDGTYRFALNAVNEDRNEVGRLQNEESNEQCAFIPDVQKSGTVFFTDCCKSRLGRFDYDQYNIDTLIDGLDGDCGIYIHNGSWTIKGVEGVFTKQQLRDWLLAHEGVHRIYPYGCENDEIAITIKDCCGEKHVITTTATEGFEITIDLLNSYFEGCMNSKLILGDENGNVVEINNTRYDADHLPTLREDSVVTILCTREEPCDCLDGIIVSNGVTFDGGTTISLDDITDSCNESFYSYSNTLTMPDNLYVAFEYGECDIDGVAIHLNGRLIPWKNSYDNTLGEYWYFDRDGHIIVKFRVDVNGIYNFMFDIKDWCGERREISVEIRMKVRIYSEDGTEIGYVMPSKLISVASDDNFVIDDVSAIGLYGRNYGAYTIDKYYITTSEGETVKLAFNGYPIDYRYNNSITVHLSL